MRFLILLFLCFKAFAHPVIYQGGYVINSSNMPDYSNNYVLYSFDTKWAIGLEHWRFSKDELNTEAGFLKLNHLLLRKNGEDYQANIYLHGGLGGVDQEWGPRGTHGIYQAGIEADWETRKLYTSLKHYEFHSPSKLDMSMTQARLGISPILADFKNLQTWFMVQGMVIDEVNERLMITPMVRFFYHNVLWEMGSSTRGEWMLNLMVHL